MSDDLLEVFRPSKRFTEVESYSPSLDKMMVRLSAFDSQFQEHYTNIPAAEVDGSSLFRERRRTAQQQIEEHIERGELPGYVKVIYA